MTLLCTTLPDNAADLAGWLEQQVVGHHLPELVAELQVASEMPTPADPDDVRAALLTVLGTNIEAVRAHGLARLPQESLRQLMRRPALLLELQEWAMIEGGPHWQRQLEAPASDPVLAAGAARLDAIFGNPIRPPAEPPRPRIAWYAQPWLVSLTTAASVLLAVYGVHLMTPPVKPVDPGPPVVVAQATGWGWDRPGALAQDVPAREYLEKLANSAEEWSRKKPDTAPALGRRLNEFRAGCSTLIFTTHVPLNERDRIWLKDRCIEWAGHIDAALTRLEDEGDVEAVRKDMDMLVTRITRALRDRATRA